MNANSHSKRKLLQLLQLAWPAVEAQPPEIRADLFEGLATACGDLCPKMRKQALIAAHDIRQASASQLHLRSLLK